MEPMLHAAELIQKKRDGAALTADEIKSLVDGIADHSVSDAQIAAFAMAVWFRGMDLLEQSTLTLAMRDSGSMLSWQQMDGPVLDKHSTGGVGDLVSLVLGPLVAAAGGYVPMISGRGLGHTGGTLDKLESIPGFDTVLDKHRFQQLVRQVGIAIIGQTADLAPADRRLYAIRDVTATVASVPLIVSSILSKKLAEGLDALVLDIKLGNGAYMQELEHAQLLGLDICRVAVEAGVACNAVITDMSQPLAWSAGNALEVHEAIDFLRGERRHQRLHAVVMALAAELLVLGGLEKDPAAAVARLSGLLDSGTAAEYFARMVAAQGGPADLLDRPATYLPAAPHVQAVAASQAGYVVAVNLKAVGLAVIQLGGGRLRAEDLVDHAVGVSGLCQPGCRVGPGGVLAVIHARSKEQWERAAKTIREAVQIADLEPGGARLPVIRARIEGGDRR
jgi:thymidine phosphorylase